MDTSRCSYTDCLYPRVEEEEYCLSCLKHKNLWKKYSRVLRKLGKLEECYEVKVGMSLSERNTRILQLRKELAAKAVNLKCDLCYQQNLSDFRICEECKFILRCRNILPDGNVCEKLLDLSYVNYCDDCLLVIDRCNMRGCPYKRTPEKAICRYHHDTYSSGVLSGGSECSNVSLPVGYVPEEIEEDSPTCIVMLLYPEGSDSDKILRWEGTDLIFHNIEKEGDNILTLVAGVTDGKHRPPTKEDIAKVVSMDEGMFVIREDYSTIDYSRPLIELFP